MTTAEKVLGVVLVGFLLSQLSCKDAIVDPPIKDPRAYKWTIDTLSYPAGSFQTNMEDIWGSSSTNVYVVGHNSDGFGNMFHFNGTGWKPVGLNPIEGGTIAGPIDLKALHGISVNQIWAVGERIYQNPNPPPNFSDSSFIIHFNGHQWLEQTLTEKGGYLEVITGTAPNNLWVAGWYGTLYHYNGQAWERDSVPLKVPQGAFFTFSAMAVRPSNEVFLTGYAHQNNLAKTTHYLSINRSGSWAVVDSFVVQPGLVENKWGYADFWVSPSGALYSCGGNVHMWNGTTWQKLFDHSSYLAGIAGSSDSNIFVVGHFGAVLHFNGKDWHQFQQFANPNESFEAVWTDGKEVIIIGTTSGFPQKTIILHGK